MLTELPVKRIEEYADRLPGAQAQLAVASLAEGHTHAQLWASPRSDILLFWDKGNVVFYLAGDADAVPDEVVDNLAALMADTIWPRAAEEGLRHFSICILSPHLERMLSGVFRGVPLHPVKKRFYAFQQSQPNDVPAPRLEEVAYLPIDANLLSRTDLANVPQVADEVRWMWSDLDAFYQHGFGVAARSGDQLICWCTAEYVSRSMCGIGIETVGEFQGRGVATATAARFVTECLRRQIRPHWESREDNPASARVAQKIGFTLVQESTFWAGQFPGR